MHTRRALLLRELKCTGKRSAPNTTTSCYNATRAPQFVPEKHEFAPHTRGGPRGCSQPHGCLEPAPHASAYANVSTRQHTSTSEHTSERRESARGMASVAAHENDTRASERAHETRAPASRSITSEYAAAATELPHTSTHTPSTHTYSRSRESRDAYREDAYTSVSYRERLGAVTAREQGPTATARELRPPEFARALGAQTARQLTTTARQLTRGRSA